MTEYVKYCEKCRYSMIPTAAFCTHCGTVAAGGSGPVEPISLKPVVAVVADPTSKCSIEELPHRLRRALPEILVPGERVDIQLKGAFKEALVCTDRQVIILKAGFMTGQIFGSSAFQVPYKNITGVQIKKHLMSGYFELSAGGVQNVPVSYWGKGQRDAAKRENCVSLNRQHFHAFQEACNVILSRISGATAAA